jgi:integrase/recombinase XerD
VIDLTLLGTWIRRFLLEHLVAERNLALNTQRSYRDTLVLLIPFVAKKAGKAVDRLSVVDMSAELIRLFLADLETSRRCAIVTRNQRLAAIHALAEVPQLSRYDLAFKRLGRRFQAIFSTTF